MRVNREALAAIRKAGGDTYKTLAERCDGVSYETIRLIEIGRTVEPGTRTIRALAAGLRVPLGAITTPDASEKARDEAVSS
jgi:transcriptional regulator with XRE-family HTH domain